ncbi:hypothetical protein NDN08_008004 [Rhodosorus marinus]|uniref:Enoyl-[acyl-carrier-protein] reductase (NADH) n=1 Tax=Rhodosorus marinus TaxID=101924 RepID=A0AAV8V488_9RHOD|nr:hypothetical protein NDN08_008004 [Rhodosorus marinus]
MLGFLQSAVLAKGGVSRNLCSARSSVFGEAACVYRPESSRVLSRNGVSRAQFSTKMMAEPIIDLKGKKALITGIANNRSIAYGIAKALHQAGAEIGVTYLPMNDKVEGKVRDLTLDLEPSLFVSCDVSKPEEIANLSEEIKSKWGTVDIFIHCLAFANREDLTGDFVNTSKDGFSLAMSISTYSLIEVTNALVPMMTDGGSIVTLSYLGAVKVVPNYNVMGVAKAGLEASVRYLAAELGPKQIRVNAVSAGSIRTLASSAIGGIQTMIKHVEANAPLRRATTTEEVGNTTAFLASDAAAGITGQVIYVDSGYEILGATIEK